MTTLERLSDAQRESLRDLSGALFGGARYRLEVGAVIDAHDRLANTSEIARILGDPPGKGGVDRELKILETAGLLGRVSPKGKKPVYWQADASPYWKMCRHYWTIAVRDQLAVTG